MHDQTNDPQQEYKREPELYSVHPIAGTTMYRVLVSHGNGQDLGAQWMHFATKPDAFMAAAEMRENAY